MNISRKTTAIIKPVGNACNLRCKYCFFHDSVPNDFQIMDEQILESFTKQYLKIAKKSANFIWHGGEPLLAGQEFFKLAMEMQEKFNINGVRINNEIQTNATLIDNSWIQFFSNYGFHVGISFDGSQKTHGRFRVYPNDKSSFAETIRGVRLMQEAQLKFGIIQVITKTALENIEENFRFFLDTLNIKSWSVSPFCGEKDCSDFMKAQAVDEEMYFEYMKKLINLWLDENRRDLRIREIDNFFAPNFGKVPNLCSHAGSCNNFFCIDYSGDIYPCGRFSGQQKYLLGNFMELGLEETLMGERCLRHIQECTTLPEDCQGCEWKAVCNNGCSYLRETPKTKYFYCQTQRKMFELTKQLAI